MQILKKMHLVIILHCEFKMAHACTEDEYHTPLLWYENDVLMRT